MSCADWTAAVSVETVSALLTRLQFQVLFKEMELAIPAGSVFVRLSSAEKHLSRVLCSGVKVTEVGMMCGG